METSTPTIASDLRLAVGRLARKVRLSETSGLTQSQLSALVTIDQIGRARLCDIAAAEGVSAPTATRIVGAIEKLGLVARTDDCEDRRATRVAVTAAGRAALRRIRSNRTAFLQQRLQRLDDHDLAVLRAALPVLAALAEDEV
ncbi:MAG TPA: MarR family transcriptional regulator [Acidimicrobiales bacterium]|nr:MarR family transcriptional regulator [Acidimicrobiales bacterium]